MIFLFFSLFEMNIPNTQKCMFEKSTNKYNFSPLLQQIAGPLSSQEWLSWTGAPETIW